MSKSSTSTLREREPDHWDEPGRERRMQHEHEPAWRAMIDRVEEDLRTLKILDFGCNQGGFLRLLHELRPYKWALGVDIARSSVEEANRLKGTAPCEYQTNEALPSMAGQFDVAFSHEVVYLLSDLSAHAKEIHGLLKQGGVYYIAIGCHTDNPLWSRWRTTVGAFSPVPPQDYSLQDIALAFQKSGFSVSVQNMPCKGFFSYDAADDRYLTSPAELVEFMTSSMMLFRMARA